MLAKGNRCLEMGMYAEAERYYRRCPEENAAGFNLGVALLRAGNVSGGMDALEKSLGVNPDLAGRLPAGGAEGLRKRPMGAFEIQPVEADEPFDPNEFEEAAVDIYREGVGRLTERDFEGAAARFRDCIEREPIFVYAWNDLGAALLLKGEFAEAIPVIEKACLLKSDNVDAYFNLGTAHSNLGNYEAALAAFQMAVELKPDMYAAYQEIEACEEALGKAPPAEGTDLGERRGVAEFYRLALLVGYLDAQRVAGWIDDEMGVPAGELPFRKRLADGESRQQVAYRAASFLEALTGETSVLRPTRVLMGVLGRKLKEDPAQARSIGEMVMRLLDVPEIPDEVREEIGVFRADVGPVAGSDLATLRQRLDLLLGPYDSSAEEFNTSGRI